MTIRQYLKEQLTKNGLWPHEADKIIFMYEANEKNMEGRWDENLADYPEQMWAILWMGAKQYALQYINQEKPKHWARPMFES